MLKPIARIAFVLTTSVALTACLKTRAQLHEDGTEPESYERVTSHASQAETRQPLEPISESDELRSEMARINGRLEELERTLNHDREQQSLAPKFDAEKNAALEKRVAELETQIASLQESLASHGKTTTPIVGSGKSETQDLFQKAKQAYASADYTNAIELASTYLKNTTARHPAEATFLRAESYFQLKQFKKAIVDYSKIPEKHLKSPLIPPSLFKIAQSFEFLGMPEDAKSFYQELVDKHGSTAEGKKAKTKLK